MRALRSVTGLLAGLVSLALLVGAGAPQTARAADPVPAAGPAADATAKSTADSVAKPAVRLDPAFRAAMKRFLVAQNIPAQMGEQMTFSAAENALQGIAGGGVQVTEPMQAIVVEEARKEFGKRFSDVEFLSDLFTGVYQNHFTLAEITELASFWESPAARKWMSETPKLNEGFFARLQEETAPMSAGFQSRLEKRLREAGILGQAP
jgi:hypothetical protein